MPAWLRPFARRVLTIPLADVIGFDVTVVPFWVKARRETSTSSACLLGAREVEG